MLNAERIIPELQDLRRGDQVSLAPGGAMPMTVMVLQPNNALVLASRVESENDIPVPGDYLRGEIASTWAFVLHPLDDTTTRLIIRFRSDWQPSLVASLMNAVVLEPVHFIMERRMLLGIKERAEREYARRRREYSDEREVAGDTCAPGPVLRAEGASMDAALGSD